MTGATLTGCNKFIDINEKGKVVPTTIDDYYDLMSDNSVFQASITNTLFASDEIHVPKDEITAIFFGSDLFANGYLWKDFIFVNETDNDPDWNNLYKAIYKSNVVLEKIDQAVGNDEVLRKKAKGEALAQRAYSYLLLVNSYARHYNPSSADKDPGVPLYLLPDINDAKPRASVQAVYDQIVKDLTDAIPLLPPTVTVNMHPGAAGAQGLLAKTYLYMGKYDLAKNAADAALGISNFLYDFNGIDFMPGMPKWLGTVGFVNRSLDNREAIWHKQASNPLTYVIGVYMTPEHVALYETGDRRLYLSVVEGAPFGNNKYGPNIWPKERNYKAGIYTPELYLIRAECNARLNHPELAMDDVNTLRKKRINTADYADLPRNKTDLEALTIVLNERRKELFTEVWRWFDLKRLNLDTRFRKDLSRTWGTETITLKPDDNNYVFPIPKKVILLNKLLEQNPRDNRQ